MRFHVLLATSLIVTLSTAGSSSAESPPPFLFQWGAGGTGNGEFSSPAGIALDLAGNVIVADAGNHRIQKFSPTGRFIHKWSMPNNGFPVGVAVGEDGSIYATDPLHSCIAVFSETGNLLRTLCDPSLNYPTGIAIDGSGRLYVANTGRVSVLSSIGEALFSLDAADGGGLSPQVSGVALDSTGNIYIEDFGNNRILKLDHARKYLLSWGSAGNGDGQFNGPFGLAVDRDGDVYVVDTGNHRIQKFNGRGDLLTQWGSLGSDAGQFLDPRGICVTQRSNVYVADTGNNRIEAFGVVLVPDCPRSPSFWRNLCSADARGTGKGVLTGDQLVDIANCVDVSSNAFQWDGLGGREDATNGFCSTIANRSSHTLEKAAERDFAILLANLCASGITTSKGDLISLDSHSIFSCEALHTGTVGDLANAVDVLLVQLRAEGADPNDSRYRALAECAADALRGSPGSQCSGSTASAERAAGDMELQGNGRVLPGGFNLSRPAPNPFGQFTAIRYSLSSEMFVEIRIYDAVGHQIWTLVNATRSPGEYTVHWDGRSDSGFPLGRGVYFLRAVVNGRRAGVERVLYLR